MMKGRKGKDWTILAHSLVHVSKGRFLSEAPRSVSNSYAWVFQTYINFCSPFDILGDKGYENDKGS